MTDGDGSAFPMLTAFHQRSVSESCRSAPSRKAGGAPRSNDEGAPKCPEAPGLSVLSKEKDSQPTEDFKNSTEAENGSNQKDVFSSNHHLKNPSVSDPTTHLNLSLQKKKKKTVFWTPLDMEPRKNSEVNLSTTISSVGSPASNGYSGENVVSANKDSESIVKTTEGFPGHFSKMQHLLKIVGKSSEVR